MTFPFSPPLISSGRLTLTFVASSGFGGTGDLIIPLPAGAAVGDLCIATGQTVVATVATPLGWTELFSNTTVRDAVGCAKVLDAADISAGSVDLGGDAADAADGVAIILRPTHKAIATITPADWTSEGTSGDPASQTANASGGTAPLVVVGIAFAPAGTAAFSTESPAFDGSALNSESDVIIGYKVYYSAPQDHTIDMADLGVSNVLASGYIQLT